ncbi:MAG TPA: MOSC domain-containing protein [Paracoccaceae bacterium]|nr:MOSC domain-containing protein [Paracoccaceae bacterium]
MVHTVTHLWRHPIKAIGREALSFLDLTEGKTVPWDRVWALRHAAAKVPAGLTDWALCVNFCIGSKFPQLNAVTAEVDEAAGAVTLRHPSAGVLTVNPDLVEDAQRLIEWIAPFTPENRFPPVSVETVPGRGMTDSPYPSISICNHASRRALSEALGRDLEMERFRANIWFDCDAPFAEFDLVGREIGIGSARLKVKERITRCNATRINPISGESDADTLGALESGWSMQEFGVYAVVTKDGQIRPEDTIEVLS